MKASIIVALLLAPSVLAVTASAQAKPAPLNMQPIALSTSGTDINTGPVLTTLEADYFRAPQQPYAANRVFPCRLELRVFEKTRLAQSCN